MPSQSQITLPGAKLTPGPDDDLIYWLQRLRRQNVSVSARIRQAVRESIEREDEIITRLDRIEVMLAAGQCNPRPTAPADQTQTQTFNDPLLDADL